MYIVYLYLYIWQTVRLYESLHVVFHLLSVTWHQFLMRFSFLSKIMPISKSHFHSCRMIMTNIGSCDWQGRQVGMVQSFLPYITFLNSKLERIHLCSLSDLGQLMFSAVNPLAETHGSQKLSVIPTPYASQLLCFCHLTLFTLILFSLLCFVIPPCVLIFRGPVFHG